MVIRIEDYISEPMLEFLKKNFQTRPDAELKIQIQEFLKFMIIVSTMASSFIPVNKDIDEIWHEFILQTWEYHSLCNKLPTPHYIHHQTISLGKYAEKNHRSAVVESLLSWIPAYVHFFGPFQESVAKYWVICTFLRNEMNLSLEEINALGAEFYSKAA